MEIGHFDDFLAIARGQDEPQRLLLVFANTELPADHTTDQAQRHAKGQGGALTPSMCVDKTPEEIGSFSSLLTESKQMGQPWQIFFVGALDGRNGQAPTSASAEVHLERMVNNVGSGNIQYYLAFDTEGAPVRFVA